MPPKVISTLQALEKEFPEFLEANRESRRVWALKKYLSTGGVSKISRTANPSKPELIYPTKRKLDALKTEYTLKKKQIEAEKVKWEKRYRDAMNQKNLLAIKKWVMPIYWQHVKQYLTDKEYKMAYDHAGISEDLAAHPKLGKMFEMFVKSKEYRDRLIETVDNSVVYSKDKTLGKNADVSREFVIGVAKKKIDQYAQQISQIKEILRAINILYKWAEE